MSGNSVHTMTEHVRLREPEHPLAPRVPARDLAPDVRCEDRVIGDAVHAHVVSPSDSTGTTHNTAGNMDRSVMRLPPCGGHTSGPMAYGVNRQKHCSLVWSAD